MGCPYTACQKSLFDKLTYKNPTSLSWIFRVLLNAKGAFCPPHTSPLHHQLAAVIVSKDAGLEHIRFHDLWHTFATLALQNGIDVKTVSSMLGHSSAGFTLATYTHATNKVQEQAAAKMGNLLKQAL